RMLQENPQFASGEKNIDEAVFSQYLSMAWAPAPDLFIRTGGESRISNFLVWQLAYTELYFTSRHWPEFDESDLHTAIDWYANRERRFGKISEQLAINPSEVSI